MIKVKRFCRVCGTKTEMTFDGSSPRKKDVHYFTCEKGHHCEVFVSPNLMKALKENSA